MTEILPYIAIVFSVLSSLFVVAEKIFGGGNALASKFHALDKDTGTAVAVVRNELNARIERCETGLNTKIDEYEKVATVGFEAIKSNIHAMQLGLLEFRAKISEDLHLYIRKDDYNAGVGDIKRDVQAGFRSMDERMGQLQDLITWANPDIPNRPGHPKAR